MLDFRTLQARRAPRTTSDLLFMGAVADTSHSVYSGLIRIRRGTVKSDAVQTNHNLVLDAGAHADSVPNLDIEENDVKCSHGSTVGPVDEDQRYYLESRGVEPERAEQLIVAGFFESIADQVPVPGAHDLVGRSLAAPGQGCPMTEGTGVTDRQAHDGTTVCGGGRGAREARRFDVAGHRVALVRIGDESTPSAIVAAMLITPSPKARWTPSAPSSARSIRAPSRWSPASRRPCRPRCPSRCIGWRSTARTCWWWS